MQMIAKKPALALGVTALIVFGASGISAQARTNASTTGTTPTTQRGPGGGGHGENTAALAKALGVSTTELQTAMAAVRAADGKDPAAQRAAEAKAIADALGVSTDTVQTVLDAQAPTGGPRGPKGDRPTGTTPPAASPTGTTPPVGTTPPAGGPRGGGHGGPRGGDPADRTALVTALVKATGKSETEVKAALTKSDSVRDAARKAEAAQFAKDLATRLGLDADKVTAAIDASRPARPTQAANQSSSQTK